ncbi:pilus assembly protein PilP [Pseudomonas sp. PSKL.D1]|uniref:pilus assembly protein PilP n=1 Tax=Pseudomonas sp. PSKL.D1 TaxID=3029060 RepID=UPI002380EB3B|nr:pilus assembly protein PilP [Pseudomonas sp. PSKL.D1]WDY58346.1 pilus assembly protein PilP [Pseudomonas sp. PSKL.D1]
MVLSVLHFDWHALLRRYRLLSQVLPIGVACLVLALGWWVRQPVWHRVHAHEQRTHEALSSEYEAKAATALTRASVQRAQDDANQLLQDARWRLAAGDGMSELLDQLAASAHAYGLLFEQLDVLDDVRQPGYLETPLDMQVVGRYSALRMWLDDWLGQTRLLRVGDMQLIDAGDRSGLLRMRLRVSAYQADAAARVPVSLAETPARAPVMPPELDPFSAWSTRVVREGLASMPLVHLQMVGSLSRGSAREAVLAAGGRLYRVRKGDRLGRDEGVVVQIGEQQVAVRERLYMGGAWRERTTLLTLRKGVDREVKEDEMADEVGSGGDDAHTAGDGGAPSG